MFKALVEFKFQNKNNAKIVFDSVVPEIKNENFLRSKSVIKLNGEKILLDIKANNKAAFKASLNNHVKAVNLSSKILYLEEW